MINVLFAGNSKVFDGVLTCALSILKRTSTKRAFNFYIMTMDITRLKPEYTAVSDDLIQFLQGVVKEYNPENNVIKLDVGDIYEQELRDCPNEQSSYSPYALLRLLADKVDCIPDKLLYLDIDIMFNKDITLLYDIDVEGYEYAAAKDHYGKFLLNPHYINSGVLLFNMKTIRQSGLLKKAREILKHKKLIFPDQSAIFRSTTRRKIISQRFNDQKFLYKKTVVRHFSKRLFWLPYPHIENIKQWHVEKVHKKFRYHCFDDVFDEYFRLKAQYDNSK